MSELVLPKGKVTRCSIVEYAAGSTGALFPGLVVLRPRRVPLTRQRRRRRSIVDGLILQS